MTRADTLFLFALAYFALTGMCAAGAFYQGIQDGKAMRPLPRFVPPTEFAQYGFSGTLGDEPARWSDLALDAGTL